jgi:hypothetical protein
MRVNLCRYDSDSNGEDLEGFAGAGLYESVTVGGLYTLHPVAVQSMYTLLYTLPT